MRYEVANSIGQVGERRVSEALHGETRAHGAVLIDDILLDLGDTTAQIDHVWIDRFGILLVETKVRNHAVIKGKSGERNWTVCYAGKKRERMQNPLEQNDRHREKLHRALFAFGKNLPANYVQSLIVFSGAQLQGLGVDDVDSQRVITDREVVDFVRDRFNFHPNEGALTTAEIDELGSIVRTLNRRGNLEVEQRHAEAVRGSSSRFGRRGTPRRPSGKKAVRSLQDIGYDFGRQSSRYPDGTHAGRPKNPKADRLLRELLKVALLLGLGYWLILGGGFVAAARAFDAAGPTLAALMVPSSSSPALGGAAAAAPSGTGAPGAVPASKATPTPNVPLALARVNERDTRLVQSMVNRNDPKIAVGDGTITYTWDFIAQTAGNSAQVQKLMLTLDAGGNVLEFGLQ